MDVLRKELNAFYEGQRLGEERLDYAVLKECRRKVGTATEVEGDCRVITDAAEDACFIFGGAFSHLLGLGESTAFVKEMDSSDEDLIYNRIHPEDLVEKRMLEYEFFRYIDTLSSNLKLNFKATCHFRIKDREGRYVFVDNSTRILQLSPKGKVWLILCCYDFSPCQAPVEGIGARIVNNLSGEVVDMELNGRRSRILTDREKQILILIREGKLSKQIAGLLGISIHTVNRHRQNILEKLSVSNSVEAVAAATLMRLL